MIGLSLRVIESLLDAIMVKGVNGGNDASNRDIGVCPLSGQGQSSLVVRDGGHLDFCAEQHALQAASHDSCLADRC